MERLIKIHELAPISRIHCFIIAQLRRRPFQRQCYLTFVCHSLFQTFRAFERQSNYFAYLANCHDLWDQADSLVTKVDTGT